MHEYVVVVMGPTGVGKSSFIQDSVSPGQRAKVKIGHTLQSETNEVQPFCWNTKDGARVKLVDTPGFDDSRAGVTDQEILARIVTFLIDVRNGLTGLIYVHRITDNRVGGTSQCNLQLFQKLCGDDSMKNVVIVTTMWDKGTTEERLQHEKELMSSNSLFKPLLDGGAVMRRHDRTHKSATNIIEYLTEKSPTTTRIFREHVQEGKALKDTAVGAELHRQIAEREKKPKEEMESLEADTREMLHNTQNVSRHRSLVQPYLVSGQHHGECVIAVMGPTGVGKSSFIHDSIPPGLSTEVKVGHGLQSDTSEVQPICWATEDGTTVKLADTPGFDDSRLGITDTDVLKMISTFLVNEYKEQRSQLTGLIYVHRISDTRVGGTSKRNLRMFRKLCGDDSLKNVVIVTTMWDKVTEAEGIRREQELKSSSDLFKPLVDEGAVMMRHDRTPQSAAHVIKYLLGKSATTTQIVRELAEERKALENTAAGTELESEIRGLLTKYKEEMESLKVELESLKAEIHQMRRGPTEERRKTKQEMEINEVAEERQQMARMMGKLSKELDDLKRGIQFDPPPVYEPTNNFPAPDTKCIVNCSKLLQLVKKYESTLPPDIATSITSCTLAFADAVERSVKGIQRGSSALKSALASEDMHTLQLLMKADPYPRAFTHGTWVTARRNMEIVTSDIEVILSTYPRQRGMWRSNPLNAILECTMEVVTGMAAMVDWWKPVTDAIGNLEDAAHHRRGGSSFANSTNTVALTRITRALDAYCKAYSECQQTVHEAALGISLK